LPFQGIKLGQYIAAENKTLRIIFAMTQIFQPLANFKFREHKSGSKKRAEVWSGWTIFSRGGAVRRPDLNCKGKAAYSAEVDSATKAGSLTPTSLLGHGKPSCPYFFVQVWPRL